MRKTFINTPKRCFSHFGFTDTNEVCEVATAYATATEHPNKWLRPCDWSHSASPAPPSICFASSHTWHQYNKGKASLFPYEDHVVVVQFNIYLATGGLSSRVKLCICPCASCRAFSSRFHSHVKSLGEYLKLVVSANTPTTTPVLVHKRAWALQLRVKSIHSIQLWDATKRFPSSHLNEIPLERSIFSSILSLTNVFSGGLSSLLEALSSHAEEESRGRCACNRREGGRRQI